MLFGIWQYLMLVSEGARWGDMASTLAAFFLTFAACAVVSVASCMLMDVPRYRARSNKKMRCAPGHRPFAPSRLQSVKLGRGWFATTLVMTLVVLHLAAETDVNFHNRVEDAAIFGPAAACSAEGAQCQLDLWQMRKLDATVKLGDPETNKAISAAFSFVGSKAALVQPAGPKAYADLFADTVIWPTLPLYTSSSTTSTITTTNRSISSAPLSYPMC